MLDITNEGIENPATVGPDNEYVTEAGDVIELFGVSPMKMQMARDKHKLPKKPTYTVTLPSGKTERFPLDEKSMLEVEGGEALWLEYQETLLEQSAKQNDEVTNALFLFGARIRHYSNKKRGWEDDQQLMGFDIPDHERWKEAYYLKTELSAKDLKGLISAIMKKSGITEEEVKQAEETF